MSLNNINAPTPPKEKEKTLGIVMMLQNLNKGQLLLMLDEAAKGIAIKSKNLGKKGTLTLILQFDPIANSNGTQVFVSGEIKTKEPTQQAKGNIFFLSDDGALSRNDPNQTLLFNEDE